MESNEASLHLIKYHENHVAKFTAGCLGDSRPKNLKAEWHTDGLCLKRGAMGHKCS